MKTGVIYLHKNKINNKVYIGQTTQKPEYRWNHGNGYKDSPYFYQAIQKYGWENFEHIILEECIPEKELNNREQYWIQYYQSNNQNFGYNLINGGHSSLNEQSLENRKKKISQWRKQNPETVQKSLKKMQEYWKAHPKEKTRVLQKMNQEALKYWEEHPIEHKKRMEKMRAMAKQKTCKAVMCIETQQIYESAREAFRLTGIHYASIGKVCNGKMKTAGGYHWRFVKEE